ncbi:MAG: ComF family protein [Candidatus Taylorbacteria bacterium]|nr:ComF family protein [Candidatus Taylorbacteria bacterium]
MFWQKLTGFFFPPDRVIECLETLSLENFSSVLRLRPKRHAGVNTLFDYSIPTVRRAIWEMKYLGNRRLTAVFGQILYEEMLAELSDLSVGEEEKFLLIPIPATRGRVIERGFNQCELLAQAVLSAGGREWLELRPELLKKVRETKRQTELGDKKERARNIDGAFRAAPAVADKVVVLLDDVTTTGATSGEARRALKAAGARKVHSFALARAGVGDDKT